MSHIPTWILLPFGDGYCWGVEACPKDHRHVELHGGFKSEAEAEACKRRLVAEFSDYEYVKVVRIETPER